MNRANNKKALVVEDQPSISRLCERILAGDGFKVTIAVDGKIARDMLDREKYDLYVFDVRTPSMNGIELYRYLEANYPDVTGGVIFTTGDVFSSSVEEFLREANKPNLAKPFAPRELRQAVKEATGG